MYDLIFVAGNGKTSRANVEALVDDYIQANPKVQFSLCSSSGMSEGQVWLKQYLEDKEITFTVDKEIKEISSVDLDKQAIFILWNDEDTESLNALAIAKSLNICAFDLVHGLFEIQGKEGISGVVAPEIPIQEQINEYEVEPELEDDEEDEYEDPLYQAINLVASIFAEAIAKELKKVLKRND